MTDKCDEETGKIMTLNELFEICNTLITTPLSFFQIYMLTKEWRYSRKKTVVIGAASILALLALDFLVCSRMGVNRARDIVSVLNFTTLLFLYLFLPKYQGGKSIFICFSVSLSMFIGNAIAEIFGTTVIAYRLLIKCAVYLFMLIVTYQYFRRPFFTVMEGIETGWHRLSAIPVMFCILLGGVLWSRNMYHDREVKMIGLVLCFAAGIIYLVLYFTFCSIQEQYRMKSGYDLLQAQMFSLQKQLEIVRESGKELDILRHDMRHYIMLLSACVEHGDLEEAGKLMNSLELSLESANKKCRTYTGNILIDAILSEYEGRAENGGIRYDVLLALPETLKNNPIEFAVVISNALENACIACRKIPEGEERVIKVRGRTEGKQFFLEIANTFTGTVRIDEEKGRPVTEQAGHGLGTQSIEAFAEKYHAYLRYQAGNGWFRLRLVL